MIISHKLKVIYIRPKKVASTSFEIALSKYCGPEDIITRHNLVYKRAMTEVLGARDEQNNINLKTKKRKFKNHSSAQKIKESVPEEIWNNYLKITVIRCPYDRMISALWANCLHSALTNKNFLSFSDIHINGEIAADFVIRYEHLAEDIRKLETKIDCPGLLKTFQNIKARGDNRPQGYTNYFFYSKYPPMKRLVDKYLYENQDMEFSRKYWPSYKLDLEKTLAESLHKLSFKQRIKYINIISFIVAVCLLMPRYIISKTYFVSKITKLVKTYL